MSKLISMNEHFIHCLKWLSEHHIHPTPDEITFLKKHASTVLIPKKAQMLEQGKPVKYFYFMNSGIARLFMNYQGKDITIAFVAAPLFASTIQYLLNGKDSHLAIEACTEIEAIQWTKDDIIQLKKHTSIGEPLENAFTETLLEWNLKREIDRLILTPEERYANLLKETPQVLQQVPVKYIASYLGIHQDSLSRIRNRQARKF